MRHLLTSLLCGFLLSACSQTTPTSTASSAMTKPTPPPAPAPSAQVSTATFGGGCFWCLEAVFQRVIGVSKVVSGYSGGQTETPSYKAVCEGDTGHAEAIQITFDPAVISYADLLEIFWDIHDPTTANRQGHDVGTQYRSVIFTHDEAQRAAAEASKTQAQPHFPQPIVTQIVPLVKFYTAEAYHQNYFNQNPNQPYCMAVVSPKVEKFLRKHGDKAVKTP
jgi:peptide-methionine (S)-S-oxide reductase